LLTNGNIIQIWYHQIRKLNLVSRPLTSQHFHKCILITHTVKMHYTQCVRILSNQNRHDSDLHPTIYNASVNDAKAKAKKQNKTDLIKQTYIKYS